MKRQQIFIDPTIPHKGSRSHKLNQANNQSERTHNSRDKPSDKDKQNVKKSENQSGSKGGKSQDHKNKSAKANVSKKAGNNGNLNKKQSDDEKNKSDSDEILELSRIDNQNKNGAKNNKKFEKFDKETTENALKEIIKESKKNKFKLHGLLQSADKTIINIKNIIPLLPSEIQVDTAKITIIKRPFFFSERIHSISVKDISDVFIETAPFFATIIIVDKNFVETEIKEKWFWKKDAEKARRIITGLLAISREQIDLIGIKDDSLAEKLEEIGKLNEKTTSVSNA